MAGRAIGEAGGIIVVVIEKAARPGYPNVGFDDRVTAKTLRSVLGSMIKSASGIRHDSRRLVGRMATRARGKAVMGNRTARPGSADVGRYGQMAARALALAAGTVIKSGSAHRDFRTLIRVARRTRRRRRAEVGVEDSQGCARSIDSVGHAHLGYPARPLARHRRTGMAADAIRHSWKHVNHLVLNNVLNGGITGIARMAAHTCGRGG